MYYLYPLLGLSSKMPDFEVLDYLEQGYDNNLIFDE